MLSRDVLYITDIQQKALLFRKKNSGHNSSHAAEVQNLNRDFIIQALAQLLRQTSFMRRIGNKHSIHHWCVQKGEFTGTLRTL